ncbi:MAG: hypothetical protein OHK0039_48030 [Bacteroidia bacterium]
MKRFVLKRLLLVLPTLWLLSLLVFWLGSQFSLEYARHNCITDNPEGWQYYRQCQLDFLKKYYLDKPVFYLRIGSLAEPDTLHVFVEEKERRAIDRLIYTFGNWPRIDAYRATLYRLHRAARQVAENSLTATEKHHLQEVKQKTGSLITTGDTAEIGRLLWQADTCIAGQPYEAMLAVPLSESRQALQELAAHPTRWRYYVPRVWWCGDNQYHRWLTGVLRGDLGMSYSVSSETISQSVRRRIGLTIYFSLLSVVLVYVLAVPLGVVAAVYAHTLLDQGLAVLLFALRALPSFWVATLMLILLYHLDIPTKFSGSFSDLPELLRQSWAPLIAYSYGALAAISRITRARMLDVLGLDYIRTARAKGLPPGRIIWRHAFRNALGPLITLLAGIFPALVGGSVVLEKIFNINGMGRLILESSLKGDRPVVMAVFMLIGLLTVLGYLIGDLLNAWSDPQIRLD